MTEGGSHSLGESAYEGYFAALLRGDRAECGAASSRNSSLRECR